MGFLSVLSFAQRLIAERVKAGDIAIDATAGNGVDTLFLAERVGQHGTVYGFDIQHQALDRTAERLRNAGWRVDYAAGDAQTETLLKASGGAEPDGMARLILHNHAELATVIPAPLHGRVAAIMFNLGYLPGSDDLSIITQPHTTISALDGALQLLQPGGIVTIVVYPGHPGGKAECDAVETWIKQRCQQSDRRFTAIRYSMEHAELAPYLLAIETSSKGEL